MSESSKILYLELCRRVRDAAVDNCAEAAFPFGSHKISALEWGYDARYGLLESIRDRVYWRPKHGEFAAYPVNLTELAADEAWRVMLIGMPSAAFKKGYQSL